MLRKSLFVLLVAVLSLTIVVPALARALSDPHFDVRINAADALGVLGDWATAAVPALIKASGDEEWWVRHNAAAALRGLGRRADDRHGPDRFNGSVQCQQIGSGGDVTDRLHQGTDIA